MSDVVKPANSCACAERVAFDLFKELKYQISQPQNGGDFSRMQDRDRQQYLLDLYKSCLDAVMLKEPCVPEIGAKKG